MPRMLKTRWFMPLFSVFLGGAVFAALWIGGDFTGAVISFAILAGVGLAVLVFGERSETVRGLRGDGRDERFALIDLRATAFAGHVVIAAIIVGWLVQVARGEDANPYGWLGALAGIAYIVGVVL